MPPNQLLMVRGPVAMIILRRTKAIVRDCVTGSRHTADVERILIDTPGEWAKAFVDRSIRP